MAIETKIIEDKLSDSSVAYDLEIKLDGVQKLVFFCNDKKAANELKELIDESVVDINIETVS